jgi:hypothetical protein
VPVAIADAAAVCDHHVVEQMTLAIRRVLQPLEKVANIFMCTG